MHSFKEETLRQPVESLAWQQKQWQDEQDSTLAALSTCEERRNMGRELNALHRPTVTSPFAPLELANGCFERIIFQQGNLRVAGWMLLPDQSFNSFQLWMDGQFLGTADKVMRLDLADVHPWLSHARDSGFRFSISVQIPEHTTVRIDVLGCRGTEPLARLSTWFTLDFKQAVPTPP